MFIENSHNYIKIFEGNTCFGYSKRFYKVIEIITKTYNTYKIYHNDKLIYQKTIKGNDGK